METDRGAVLTARAATRGVIDFSKAELLDPAWWRRCRIITNTLEDEAALERVKAVLAYECALVGIPGLDDKSFEQRQANMRKFLERIWHLTKPWQDGNEGEATKQLHDELVNAYKQLIGDPKDPEFAAKLKADLVADEARRAAAKQETDEQRVERLLFERNARKR